MFDLSWSHIAILVVVALLVLGPKELPNAIRTGAQLLRTGRKLAGEFRSGMDELLREAELGSSSAPVFLTLGVVSWTTMARVIRGKARVLARSEMISAARAALSMRSTWAGKASRKKPEMRNVTSTRGRPSSVIGIEFQYLLVHLNRLRLIIGILFERDATREQLGREAFTERVWEWKHQYGNAITDQIQFS